MTDPDSQASRAEENRPAWDVNARAILKDARQMLEEVDKFQASALEDGLTAGNALNASTLFSVKGAEITALGVGQSVEAVYATHHALDKIEHVLAETSAATEHMRDVASRLDAVAEHGQSVYERVERLHQPRGLILVGTLVFLSNVVGGGVLLLLYLGLSELLSQVTPSRAFAEGVAGSIVAGVAVALLAVAYRKARSLLDKG